jgi:predicted aspartyl protease
VTADALIDTGAELSMMPTGVAQAVGAWLTNYTQALTGIHGDSRTFPVVVADIAFSDLKVGGRFAFAMSNFTSETIIGMDVLKPLGISVDTASHQLSVKNEVWEAFKTLAAIGVLVIGGVKLLEPK